MKKIKVYELFANSLTVISPLLTPEKREFQRKAMAELKRAADTARRRSRYHAVGAGKFLTALAVTLLVLPAPMASAGLLAQVYQTGPAFIIDSESAPFGNASAELARGESIGAGSYSYVGSAYANSTRGSLGVAAQATGSGYDVTSNRLVVHSRATLSDAFIFSDSGNVTFRLDVHGSFAGDVGGQMTSDAELELFCGGCTATANAYWRGGSSLLGVSTRETVISALPSNYQVWLESTIGVTAGIPVPFEAILEVYVSPPVTGDARALFGQTAQLMLLLPTGMTYTSQTGDYLLQVQPPITVSEPSMAVTALALLALMRGIRRSASKRRR